MNIFKTFEVFLREPLSILKARFIQIVSVNSPIIAQSSINVDFTDNQTQITVMNSDKMYNLFQTVLHKQRMQAAQRLLPTQRKGQVVIGQLCKRT